MFIRGSAIMYAIIRSGGRQFKVEKGQKYVLPYLPESSKGDCVEFEVILFKNDDDTIKIGAPVLSNVTVKGKLMNNGLDKKVVIQKFKKRKRYKRKTGHRQPNSSVTITDIIEN